MKPTIKDLPRFALLGLALLSFSQCKKTDPIATQPVPEALPPETQEGKNTLGFMLDGKLWNARIDPWESGKSETKTSYYHGSLSISAHRILGDSIDYQFVFNSTLSNPINKVGTYTMGNIMTEGIGIVLYDDKPDNKKYKSYGYDPGKITITKLDTLSHPGIISGTFNVNLYYGNDEKLETKDGRFDLKLP